MTIINKELNLSGVTIFDPNEKRPNPRAGSPEYVYLVEGEGVRLTGPEISLERLRVGNLFYLENPQIKLLIATEYHAEGYKVTVNPHLSYRITIEDFEYEVGLACVELIREGDRIKSTFIFLADEKHRGVAHEITVTALVNGNTTGSSASISVEVR